MPSDPPTRVSRLAPSPTGALHLGNARSFLINWAIARQSGWRLVMRIEDLDGPRNKPHADEHALDILSWLGMDWDDEPLRQAADLAPYVRAMRELADDGHVFACALSRREVAAASAAPHRGDREVRFDPSLRPTDPAAWRFDLQDTNYRFKAPDEALRVEDVVAGPVMNNPHRDVGDFVVWTKRAEPGYQLAVVVDDLRQGVTDVIRGDDLLRSAARQMLIYRALGHDPPRWWHLPLVLGEDGHRLAKRHGDTRIATYRDQNVPPERIIGLIAHWSGITAARAPMTSAEFRSRFDVDRLPRCPITLTREDELWLRNG